MKHRWRLMASTACAALGLAGPVPAQNTSLPETPPAISRETANTVSLSLQDALDRALKHNPDLLAARAGLGGYRGRLTHASRWLPANPRLELEAGRRETGNGDSTDKGLRLSQEIWIAGQRGLGKAAASARLDAATQRLDYLRTSVLARVRSAYLRMLLARESVSTAERARDLTARLHRYAGKRFEAGGTTRLVVNTTRIGKARAEVALARARQDRVDARLALIDLLALDAATTTLELTTPLDLRGFTLPRLEPLLDDAVQRRRDLRAAAREVVAARNELALSKRRLIPNLTVFGFSKSEEGADISGLGISMPIPVWDARSGENRVARSRLEQARIERDDLRRRVRAEVLNALNAYRAAGQQLAAFGEDILTSAEDNMRLTEQAFRAGRMGAPAITGAQSALIETRQQYLNTLKDAIEAAARLERATGGLVTLNEAGADRAGAKGDVRS